MQAQRRAPGRARRPLGGPLRRRGSRGEALSARGRLAAAWDRFFFAEKSAVSLACFRIAFALALLIELPVSWSRNVAAVRGPAFHLAYLEAVPRIPEGLYHALHAVQLPLILALGAGRFVRPACGWLLAIQAWLFFADVQNFRNHPYLFLLILLLLAISPCDRALALGRRASGGGPVPGRAYPVTVQRLLQLEICLVYAFAGLQKLHPYYFSGEVIVIHQQELSPLRERVLGALLDPGALAAVQRAFEAPSTWVLPSYFTVILELALPVSLWIPRLQGASMAVGVAFHVAIALTLGIYEFTIVMIASYLLFLDPDSVARFLRERQSRKAHRRERLARSSRSGGGIA